jgi:hypothetical protein
MMAMNDHVQFAALEIVRHSKAEIGFTTLSSLTDNRQLTTGNFPPDS